MTTFDATLVRVIDGDTFVADLDLGISGLWRHGAKIRIDGIDAPEVTGATKVAGLAAKEFLRENLSSGTDLRILVRDSDAFGRVLGSVTYKSHAGSIVDVTKLLVENGHAGYRTYQLKIQDVDWNKEEQESK